MISKLHLQYITLLSLFVILLNSLFFGDLSIDFIFLLGVFIVVLVSVGLIQFCQKYFLQLPEKKFIKQIFWFSLGLRLFSVLFYHTLFYYITETEFDVEAIDALDYHESALRTSESILNGTFTFTKFLIDIKAQFDDSGYVIFLSLIYCIFDNSIIAVRLIQALISAATVVTIYKVSKSIFGEQTAKLSAILVATFHLLLLFVELHLKETLMVYFLVLYTNQCIKLINEKKISSIPLLGFSLVAMFSFRTILGLSSLISLAGFWLLSGKKIVTIKKIVILLIAGVFISIVAVNISALSDTVYKSKKYVGVKTDEEGSAGGVSQEAYLSGGQSFAQYAGGGVFLVQSIIMPYPSMVKTNIVFFNQTLQWYFAGTLFVWIFLSYYSYIGIYFSVKNYFKQSSILLFNVAIYTVALVAAIYITSVRQNIIKLVLLMPFVAYGVICSSQRTRDNFIKYAIVMCAIVLLWNYIKVAGRGMI